MAQEITNLDAYLLMPDCPQCGSEDVVIRETKTDAFGNTINIYYCEKCGHTWAEKA